MPTRVPCGAVPGWGIDPKLRFLKPYAEHRQPGGAIGSSTSFPIVASGRLFRRGVGSL